MLARKYPVFTEHEVLQYYEEFVEFDADGSGDIDKYEIMQLFRHEFSWV